MPRVLLKKKDYKVCDFTKWLAVKMLEYGLTRRELGSWLGITSQAMSKKMMSGRYTYSDLLTILGKIPATDSEIIQFMRVK